MSQNVLHSGELRWGEKGERAEPWQLPLCSLVYQEPCTTLHLSSEERILSLQEYRRLPWGMKDSPRGGRAHSGPQGRRFWS